MSASMDSDASVRTYERQAEENRRRLSSTLDELSDNLTPGRMVDEVLSYAKAGGGDFLKGLGNAASANPIPTLLMGVGAAMFLSGKGRADPGADQSGGGLLQSLGLGLGLAPSRRPVRTGAPVRAGTYDPRMARDYDRHAGSDHGGIGESVRHAGSRVADSVSHAGASVKHGVSDAAASVKHGVSDATGSVKHGVSDAAHSVRDGVASAGAAVSEAAGDLADSASDTLHQAGDAVSGFAASVGEAAGEAAETARAYAARAGQAGMEEAEWLREQSTAFFTDMRDRGTRLAHEQPLVVAAIGLALGAAVAALLPRTKLEDSCMGDASDAVKEEIGGIAQHEVEQVKAAAGKIAEDAKETAAEAGLSAEGAADTIRNAGERVASAIKGETPETKTGSSASKAPASGSTPDWKTSGPTGTPSSTKS